LNDLTIESNGLYSAGGQHLWSLAMWWHSWLRWQPWWGRRNDSGRNDHRWRMHRRSNPTF